MVSVQFELVRVPKGLLYGVTLANDVTVALQDQVALRKGTQHAPELLGLYMMVTLNASFADKGGAGSDGTFGVS